MKLKICNEWPEMACTVLLLPYVMQLNIFNAALYSA